MAGCLVKHRDTFTFTLSDAVVTLSSSSNSRHVGSSGVKLKSTVKVKCPLGVWVWCPCQVSRQATTRFKRYRGGGGQTHGYMSKTTVDQNAAHSCHHLQINLRTVQSYVSSLSGPNVLRYLGWQPPCSATFMPNYTESMVFPTHSLYLRLLWHSLSLWST
jgi:hypothetical protein